MKTSAFLSRVFSALAAVLALGGGLTSGADFPTTVLDLSPVGYWRLDTTNPLVQLLATNRGTLGQAFDGQYQAMLPSAFGVPGAIDNDPDTAVSIDGTQGHQIVVPFSPVYNPEGPFTVECWASSAGAAGGNHTLLQAMVQGQNPANANDRTGWNLRQVGADLQMLFGTPTGAPFYYYYTASGVVAAGAWQHIVVSYDGTSPTMYVNGSPVGVTVTRNDGVAMTPEEIAAIRIMPNIGGPLIIGDRGYTGWDFIGQVDEVAIYTNALTEDEVLAHYVNGTDSARTTPYPQLVLQKNPALYFRLGEPSIPFPSSPNLGSYAPIDDGIYMPGTTSGLPGLRQPAATGFPSTNAAAGFNGLAGSVRIPAGFPLNSDTVTMLCWIKRDGPQPTRAGIMHNRKVTAPEVKATGLGFQDDGLALSYNWNDIGNTYNFNPGFVPPDQMWTFFAVAVAPDAQVMYMGTASGLRAATNNYAVAPHDFSGTSLELGWDNYQTTRIFRGAIDEFALFDRTLSYEEIASIFNSALPAILGVTRVPADPVYEGLQVTFRTTVAGPAPITYQWRKGGVPIAGQTGSTLVLSNVTTANSGNYDVQATTGGQTLTSPASQLTVLTSPPIITQAPASAQRMINGQVSFTVATVGSQPQTYQWRHGNDVIPGATGPTLTLTDLQPADAGNYTVVITNPLGQAQATASLGLNTPSLYTAAVVDGSPVGYWRLNEPSGTNVYDLWGGHDGTHTAGVTNNLPGPQPPDFTGLESTNVGYAFAGNAAQVVIPPLNLNKATATIVAWIKPRGSQVSYAGIIFARGGTATGLDYNGTSGSLGYHWNDAANTYNWNSGLSPTPDEWNFVALVVEPAQATMYLDSGDGNGLRSSVNTVTHNAASFADPLRFGVDSPGGGRGFIGLIDEVAVYDRALTSDDVMALHEAGYSGSYTPTPPNIVQQPEGETIMVGSSYTLSAEVTGSVPITYQWRKNGQPIPGAIRSRLDFPSAVEADTGVYELVVTQGPNTVTTDPVTLTVKPVPSYLDLPQDLVLHLKFDGNTSDSSGRDNHGTAVNDPPFISGVVGSGALHYETTLSGGAVAKASYVNLGTPSDLDIGPEQDFTVAFWTRFTGSPGDLPFFGNTVNSYGDPGIDFAPSWQEGSWSWYISDKSSSAWQGIGVYAPVRNSLNDGEWHHLVHIFDRSAQGITYLDGVKANETPISTGASWDFAVPGRDWMIGQGANRDYAVEGAFDIDDLGFWRRTLNEYEAQSIYIVGKNYGRSFDSTAPPELTILRGAGTVTVSWQGTATSHVLQTSPVLPATTWTPVPSNTYQVNGNTVSVTIPTPPAGKLFCRLVMQ